MTKDGYDRDKKREITELISSIISSRINLTTHREIAAWTITAFYITAIIAIYKYLIEPDTISDIQFSFATMSIMFFCFIVIIFIHSQYGAHVSSRTEYHVCVKKMFQIINKDEILNNENCKVKDDKTFYPGFIQSEITSITKEDHKISKIGPWVIYIWFFKSVFKNFINILIKFKILSDDSKIYFKTKNLDSNMSKNYAKMHLLESSLYNMVLLPTLIFLILYSYKFYCLK